MNIATFTKQLTAFVRNLIPIVEAHCDTADGPAVVDGRIALETGNINFALKWIPASGENELRGVFTKVLRVRDLGAEAREVADRLFLETLVRLHREAEGVRFTGIQPSGVAVDPVVAAADLAIASGDDEPLRALVPVDRFDELHRRFQVARGKRDFDVDDVAAGREYVAAYVSYFKYAEGEEHGHGRAEHEHAASAEHAH